MSDRDLFANFERMRREMDELFGDVFDRSGLSRRRGGRWPAIDVALAADPPRVIVTAELAGVDASEITLQIEGRTLLLAGRRLAAAADPVEYHQVEIERGQFRRLIELPIDVQSDAASARYQDGMLRVELPIVSRHGQPREVPIESRERS